MNDPAFLAGREVVASTAAAPLCPEPSPTPTEKAFRLLPPVAYAPWQILLWAVIPQLLLLACNFGNYQTIAGDLSSVARGHWHGVMVSGALLAAGYCVLSVAMWRRKAEVSAGLAVAALTPMIAFVNYAVWQLVDTIPRGAQWILSGEEVVIQNLTGSMPIAVYFGSVICGGRMRATSRETGKAVVCAVAIGMSLLLAFEFNRFEWMAVIGISMATLLCLFGILRLLILACCRFSHLSAAGLALVGMWIGVLMPAIGLWVNHWVPFPYDFQLPWIYAFALTNGVLLSLPVPANTIVRRALWLAQCAGLSFTLYFFVVFLPFVPLTALGLVIWGGGLLVLVPTCVFVLHVFRVVDGLRRECDEWGQGRRRWGPVLAGVAAFLVVPGGIVWRASADRSVLHKALDYLYVASPQKSDLFDGSPEALRRTLVHVQEVKAGKRLPLVSGFYDEVVFDGLTLPDTKMKELSRTFLSEEIVVESRRRIWGRRGGFGMRGGRLADPPHTDVAQLPVRVSHRLDHVDARFVRATAMVNMQNNRPQQGEFKTTLTLPENVAVTGFWLHIGDERVPGRMTEKKSAMWVYQMIRDVTRRDPGVLRYIAPDQLELRVFPLAGHETRKVEIEFLAPVSIDDPVVIGGENVALNDGSSRESLGICMARSESGASVAIASESFSNSLPTMRREPYLHLIVDYSAASRLSQAEIASAIASARVLVPEAAMGSATLANFEMLDVVREPVALDVLSDTVAAAMDQLPRRGGFLPGRAMHRVLAKSAAQFRLARPGDSVFERYPVFMILGAAHALDLEAEKLSWLATLVPDVSAYYVMEARRPGWEVRAIGGTGDTGKTGKFGNFGIERWANGTPVHIFRVGNANAMVRGGAAGVAHVHGRGVALGQPGLSIFDPRTKRYSAVTDADWIGGERSYARALHLWRQQQLSLVDPSAAGRGSLRDMVMESRESGILTNATAYIAVESHAQWKMLEEAEKKKLKSHKGFEFGETPPISSVPEPSTGLLVLVAGMILAWQRRR